MGPRKSTKLGFNKNLDVSVEVSDKRDNKFGDILYKKWKVFRVSPIYNFSRDKLKLYEKKLNEDMNSKRTGASVCYKSRFTLNENLRLNEGCAEAIQVEIIKDDLQTIYIGNFISWSNGKPSEKGCIFLPILLVDGKAHEFYGVHSFLCKIFDCDIQPVSFSFCALITFFVKLLQTTRNGVDLSQEQIIMDYKVPGCEENDKIKLTLFLEPTVIVFAEVMDSLREKYQGITTMEIIWEFYNRLMNHFYHIYKMDFMLAELQKVTFSDAFLTSEGQLKISSVSAAESALEVLAHFTPLDAILNI